MIPVDPTGAAARTAAGLHSELLILPDGRVLAHNLTPAVAEVLRSLVSADQLLYERSRGGRAVGAPLADSAAPVSSNSSMPYDLPD